MNKYLSTALLLALFATVVVDPAHATEKTIVLTAPLRPCCDAPRSTPTLKKSLFEAGMTVQENGKPWPEGHGNDVYFTGAQPPPTRPLLPHYRFTQPSLKALKLDLSGQFSGLKTIRIRPFHETDGRTLTPGKNAEITAFLQDLYGGSARVEKLGQGGQQVAYIVCVTRSGSSKQKARKRRCDVAKVRKLANRPDPKHQQQALKASIGALRQDLAIFEAAKIVTAGATWKGKRLARVAQITRPKLLSDGIVTSEFIQFRHTAEVDRMFTALRGPDGPMRDQAWEEAPKFKFNRVRILGFFDAFPSLRKIGPDVIRLSSFVRRCDEVAAVPTARKFCDTIKRTYKIPADFLDRVRALEQLYRDSAGLVIRFKRANFKRATGNPGADGKTREIGLDYNHGRNVGWDPQTEQFVLFDA